MTGSGEIAGSTALPPGLNYIDELALYFTDSGEVIDWNESFEEYSGYSSDHTSTPVDDVFSNADQQRLRAGVRRALDTGSETVTVSIRRPESTTVTITLSLTSVPNEWTTSPRVIGIGRESADELDETVAVDRLERALSQVYEIISDDDRVLDEKIDAVLGYVRDTLGTDIGTLSHVENDEYIFKALDATEPIDINVGETVPLAWTNCERVIESRETLVLDDIEKQAPELTEKEGNVAFNINSYLGAPIFTNGEVYGTFCFYGTDSLREEFAKWEITFVNVVSKWIGHELETGQLSDEFQRRERERYETLVTQSSDGIVVIRDGVFDFVNDRFAEISGYDRSDLLGMSFETVIAPSYREIVQERYDRRIAGETPPDTYEIEILTADNEQRVLELSVSLLPESGETAVLANARDITQRKRREQSTSALQDATEQIQTADSAHRIAEIAVEAATNVLNIPYAICWLHDSDTQTLNPIAATDAIDERDGAIALTPDRYEYEVFRDGAATQFTPSEVMQDESFDTSYLFPLGDHGLLGLGYPDPIETDTMLFELATTLADHTTTALDRVMRTQELRESERRYRAIFNQTYQFMGLIELDGTLLEANETALKFGDLDPEDVIGKKIWNAYWFAHSSALQNKIKTAVERAANGEFIREEIPARGSEQMTVIDFSIRPITDETGEVTLLIPEGRNITELKEREQELRQERDHVHRTEQLARVGGWEVDLDDSTITWTAGAKRLFEVEETFEPSIEEVAEYFHPDDWDTVKEAITDCQEASAAFDLEVRMITAIGRTRWVRLQGEQIPDTDGRTIRGVIADITERREREQRLMVLNRVLRHNLRNQLGVISGYASQLESLLTTTDQSPSTSETTSCGPVDEPTQADSCANTSQERVLVPVAKVRSFTDKIAENATDLLSLAEKAQDFEKTIKHVERSHAVAVRPLIMSLIHEYETAYPAATIKTDVDSVSIWGNEEFTHRVIDELVSNAVEHSDRDAPSITVTAAEQTNGQVTITVADDGPGMPEMEKNVLKSGEESPLLHGSGVGLWTINWLISRLGGQITITANDPRGTVVTLRLPANTEKN